MLVRGAEDQCLLRPCWIDSLSQCLNHYLVERLRDDLAIELCDIKGQIIWRSEQIDLSGLRRVDGNLLSRFVLNSGFRQLRLDHDRRFMVHEHAIENSFA